MNLRTLFLQHLAQTSPHHWHLKLPAHKVVFYTTKRSQHLHLIAGTWRQRPWPSTSKSGSGRPKAIETVLAHLGVRRIHTGATSAVGCFAGRKPRWFGFGFVNSGAEATEGAMKLAKRATGAGDIVACRYAYHGSTQGAASLMWPTDFTLPSPPFCCPDSRYPL